MTKWAEDLSLPGEFTGHTGARVLSEKELEPNDPRYHAWAKKVGYLLVSSCQLIGICSLIEYTSEYTSEI